jgi:hypothetical protein
LHSSLALSVAHDVMFGATGACIALLLLHAGISSIVVIVATVGTVLLFGPATVLQTGDRVAPTGHSIYNVLSLSFRPHVALAGLLFTGFLAAWMARLGPQPSKPASAAFTLTALVTIVALLAITDEASTGLLVAGLGAAWLVEPGVIHPKRKLGIAVLGGIVAVFWASNVVFGASLGLGAPSHPFAMVPWRLPGIERPSLPLSTSAGQMAALADLLPVSCVALGGVVSAGARKGMRPVLAFAATLLVLGVFALLCIEVDAMPRESHRCMTAALFCWPILAVICLAQAERAGDVGREVRVASIALIIAGAALAVTSTLQWLFAVAPRRCEKHAGFFKADNLYDANCRADTGAVLGADATPIYAEAPIWYLYAGCNPVFAPAAPGRSWGLKVKSPFLGYAALSELNRTLAKDTPLLAICIPNAPSSDPVCDYARTHELCAPSGARTLRCTLDASVRQTILNSRVNPKTKGR